MHEVWTAAPDDANFCSKCGTPQRSGVDSSEVVVPVLPQAKIIQSEFKLKSVYVTQQMRTFQGGKARLTTATLIVQFGNGEVHTLPYSRLGSYESRAKGWFSSPAAWIVGDRGSGFALRLDFFNEQTQAKFVAKLETMIA